MTLTLSLIQSAIKGKEGSSTMEKLAPDNITNKIIFVCEEVRIKYTDKTTSPEKRCQGKVNCSLGVLGAN